MKRCSLCGEMKALAEFARNPRSKNGYNAACKQCKKARLGTGKPRLPKTQVPAGYKRCSKCTQMHPLALFSKASSSSDGYRSSCKFCDASASGRTFQPKEQLPEGLRCCTSCHNIFPLSRDYFKIEQRKSDGLSTICKPCAADYSRQYHQKAVASDPDYYKKRYQATRDVERRRWKLWYQEHKALHKSRTKAWYEANKDRARARERQRYSDKQHEFIAKSRQWRKDNQIRYRAYNRKWLEDNPQTAALIRKTVDSRRRARLRQLPHTYTNAEWMRCLEYWDYRCAVCGRDGELHADHWIPLKSANCPGTVAENMLVLCQNCNNTKSAKLPEVWLTEKLSPSAVQEKLMQISAYFEYVKSLAAS